MPIKRPAGKSTLREKDAGDIWFDEGKFSNVPQEMKNAKTAPPGWAATIAQAAQVKE